MASVLRGNTRLPDSVFVMHWTARLPSTRIMFLFTFVFRFFSSMSFHSSAH